MPRKTKPSDLDRPRVRFNWGFHDAQLDAEQDWGDRRDEAHDRPLPQGYEARYYRAGYAAGWREWDEAGKRNETSEPAWESYLLTCRLAAASGIYQAMGI